jgi:hypothetical protein
MTIDDVLFFSVYLSQVLLLSLYFPSRVLRRARALIEAYPPSEYPKLYPVPRATIERLLRFYRHLNLGLLVLGLALLAAAWKSGYTLDSVLRPGDAYPIRNPFRFAMVYTALQWLSIMLFGYWEIRYFKRMRAAARIRTAELKARRFFDFVSPALLGAAVAAYVGATVLLLFLGQLFLIRHQFLITYLPSVMTVCNVGLAGCAVWTLYGRKQNPHQSDGDRARMIRLGWQRMLVASILFSVLVAITSALLAFRLVDYIFLATSLFLQVAVAIFTGTFFVVVPFGQQSFEVYRADPNRAATLAANK